MKLNYGKILMWAAIVVSMPRWAGAFISADVANMPNWVNEALHYGNLLSGFGMGFLEVLAAAYMLDAWGKMKPKASWNAKNYDHKWKILTVFIIGLFILMPLILAPYIVSRMTNVSVGSALGNTLIQYFWAIAVVLSPAFIVGGVAIANGNLVESETKVQQEKKPEKKATLRPIADKRVRTVSGQMPTDFRLLTDEQKRTIAALTSGEVAERAAISDRTARRWKEKVSANGYHK